MWCELVRCLDPREALWTRLWWAERDWYIKHRQPTTLVQINVFTWIIFGEMSTPARRQRSPFDRCNISKQLRVCVCSFTVCESVSKGAVATSSVGLINPQVLRQISSHLLIEILYLFICVPLWFGARGSTDARQKLTFISLFTNPYSSRFETKVVLCGDELTKLADISTTNAFIIP